MAKNISTDGLVNVVSGLGTAKSKRSHNSWQYDLLSNWQQLDAAYQSNWIARQVVDVPAQDMTRKWRKIKSEGAEDIEGAEQQIRMQDRVQEAISWARLYGGAGILMVTGQDLSKPLVVDKVKKGDLTRLIVFDRFDMMARTINLYDILAENYMSADFYTIHSGHTHIHWSHFARFHGERLPRRQMVRTHGWGDSVLRKCIEDISDTVAAKGGISELMQEANIDVITREGLSEDLTSDQDKNIIDRYALFAQMKSILNMALLDGSEKLDRHTLQLSGVAPILEILMSWVAGAARIPVTKLFGTSAKGMNATGEGDLNTYYDDISAAQQTIMGEPLRILDEVLVRSALGSFPKQYDYEWPGLRDINELETAQAQFQNAQTDAKYLESGVVQLSQVQRKLQSDELYQFDDDKIEELEGLEESNMFETMPIMGEEEEKPDNFIDSYRALMVKGLTHDQVMEQLTPAE